MAFRISGIRSREIGRHFIAFNTVQKGLHHFIFYCIKNSKLMIWTFYFEIRCPARVRKHTKSNKIELINMEHNHPLKIQPKKPESKSKTRKVKQSKWGILNYTVINDGMLLTRIKIKFLFIKCFNMKKKK